jgi:hypothetical protein
MTGGDRVSLLALVDGEPFRRGATIAHRDLQVLRLALYDELVLPVGASVGLAGRDTACLAIVTESLADDSSRTMVVRAIERRH